MTSRFVRVPSLPENDVTLALLGDYPEYLNALSAFVPEIITASPALLPAEISRHPDMTVFHAGGNKLFADVSQTDTAPLLEKAGFDVTYTDALGYGYPADTALNIALMNNCAFMSDVKRPDALTNHLISGGISPVFVRQGYAKCSVCFVTDCAAITDDTTIYNALKAHDIDTLLISKGDIFLSDKHYGFIGGATGKISKDLIAVTGNLKFHRDGETIKRFARGYGVSFAELTDGRITDIGGIIPLKEKG